ncbi:MAG TPA: DUF779 domain-containing protein [Polyangiaceae bacterium]
MDVAVPRVSATVEAAALVRQLVLENGALLFHQSGGCCDGSAPMCFLRGEFRVGSRDVLLGAVENTPFYIGAEQFEYWKHTHLTLDVVPGRGSGFSLEAPRGVRFIVRSRVFDDWELEELEARPPARGPDASHG